MNQRSVEGEAEARTNRRGTNTPKKEEAEEEEEPRHKSR